MSADDAARDTRTGGVALLGAGQKNTHEHILAAPSLVDFGCKQSSAQAFARAGVTARDIDVAEIYDSFTITLLVELESIGFFARGEAGPAALPARSISADRCPAIRMAGCCPTPIRARRAGCFISWKRCGQLRGEADVRQVPDAELAFVHGDGGVLSAHCSLVLGRR